MTLRNELRDRLFFWPFDGFDIPPGKNVIVEVYPSIFRNRYPKEERNSDQHDAYSIARWLSEADQRKILEHYFHPPLTKEEQELVKKEGWILGIC